VVVELAISGVEENLAIRGRYFVLLGIGLQKKVSLRDVHETFMVARIFPT
jgi:hypothetical protein